MNFSLSAEDEAFRDELRAFLTAHPPPPDTGFDAQLAWQETLATGNWVAPHWPAEHGGRGAGFVQYGIYNAELARAQAPQPANRVGINLAGPTLLAHGSPDQQRRLLGPILTATEIWCQLFSEPDAGSDLASLTTRAERDGDGWRVTGQKVWTSYATEARFGILLARTDTGEGTKHSGISYFVCDMKAPGIDIRPLRQMTGESEFSVVFLDGTPLGPDALVGREGDGWLIASTTLAHERGTAFPLKEEIVQRIFLERLVTAARSGAAPTPAQRQRLAAAWIDAEVFRLLNLRTVHRLARGQEPGPESSLVKLHWAGLSQRLHELEVDIPGPAGIAERADGDDTAMPPWREHLWSRAASIAGGTSEVQRTILGERLLGLPREPSGSRR